MCLAHVPLTNHTREQHMEKLITVGIPFALGLWLAMSGGIAGLVCLVLFWGLALTNLNSVG